MARAAYLGCGLARGLQLDGSCADGARRCRRPSGFEQPRSLRDHRPRRSEPDLADDEATVGSGSGREHARPRQTPRAGLAFDCGRRSGDRRAPRWADVAKAHSTSRGGSLAESGRRGKQQKVVLAGGEAVDAGFRLTVLTHEVLAAVANLSGQGSNPSNREIARAAGSRTRARSQSCSRAYGVTACSRTPVATPPPTLGN